MLGFLNVLYVHQEISEMLRCLDFVFVLFETNDSKLEFEFDCTFLLLFGSDLSVRINNLELLREGEEHEHE